MGGFEQVVREGCSEEGPEEACESDVKIGVPPSISACAPPLCTPPAFPPSPELAVGE